MPYEFPISEPISASDELRDSLRSETYLPPEFIRTAITNELEKWKTHYPSTLGNSQGSEYYLAALDQIDVINSQNSNNPEQKIKFDSRELVKMMTRLLELINSGDLGIGLATKTFYEHNPSNHPDDPRLGIMRLSQDLIPNKMEFTHPDFFVHIYALALQANKIWEMANGYKFTYQGQTHQVISGDYFIKMIPDVISDLYQTSLTGNGPLSINQFKAFHENLLDVIEFESEKSTLRPNLD